MNNLYYSDPNKWSEIEKQYIFEAWVPFVSDRPLGFFIPNHGSKTEGFLTNVIDDSSPNSEHNIVTTLKRRKVVILTSDSLSKSEEFSEVLIAKIVSIKPHHRTQNWYKLLTQDKHSLFVHLPDDVTGEESYINMAQVTTIGKKLLIQKHNLLPSNRMEIVEQRHEEFVDLGVIKSDVEMASNE